DPPGIGQEVRPPLLKALVLPIQLLVGLPERRVEMGDTVVVEQALLLVEGQLLDMSSGLRPGVAEALEQLLLTLVLVLVAQTKEPLFDLGPPGIRQVEQGGPPLEMGHRRFDDDAPRPRSE